MLTGKTRRKKAIVANGSMVHAHYHRLEKKDRLGYSHSMRFRDNLSKQEVIEDIKIGTTAQKWFQKYWKSRFSYLSLELFAEVTYIEMMKLTERVTAFNIDPKKDIPKHFRILMCLNLLDTIATRPPYKAFQSTYNFLRNTLGSVIFLKNTSVDVACIESSDIRNMFETRTFSDVTSRLARKCAALSRRIVRSKPDQSDEKIRRAFAVWMKTNIVRSQRSFRSILFWFWSVRCKDAGEVSSLILRKVRQRNILLLKRTVANWKRVTLQSKVQAKEMEVNKHTINNLSIRTKLRELVRRLDVVNRSISDVEESRGRLTAELQRQLENYDALYRYCKIKSVMRKTMADIYNARVILAANISLIKLEALRTSLKDFNLDPSHIDENPSISEFARAKPRFRDSAADLLLLSDVKYSENQKRYDGISEELLVNWVNDCLVSSSFKPIPSVATLALETTRREELAKAYFANCFDVDNTTAGQKEEVKLALEQLTSNQSLPIMLMNLFILYINDSSIWKPKGPVIPELLRSKSLKFEQINCNVERVINGAAISLEDSADKLIDLTKKSRMISEQMRKSHLRAVSKHRDLTGMKQAIYNDLFLCLANHLVEKKLMAMKRKSTRPPPHLRKIRQIMSRIPFLNLRMSAQISTLLELHECTIAALFLEYSMYSELGSTCFMTIYHLWWFCRDSILGISSLKMGKIFNSILQNSRYSSLSEFDNSFTVKNLDRLATNPKGAGAVYSPLWYVPKTAEMYKSSLHRGFEGKREQVMNYAQFIVAVCTIANQKYPKGSPVAAMNFVIGHLEKNSLKDRPSHLNFRQRFLEGQVVRAFKVQEKKIDVAFNRFATAYESAKLKSTIRMNDLVNMTMEFGIYPRFVSAEDLKRILITTSHRNMGLGRMEFTEALFALAHCVDPCPYHADPSRVLYLFDSFLKPNVSLGRRRSLITGRQSTYPVKPKRAITPRAIDLDSARGSSRAVSPRSAECSGFAPGMLSPVMLSPLSTGRHIPRRGDYDDHKQTPDNETDGVRIEAVPNVFTPTLAKPIEVPQKIRLNPIVIQKLREEGLLPKWQSHTYSNDISGHITSLARVARTMASSSKDLLRRKDEKDKDKKKKLGASLTGLLDDSVSVQNQGSESPQVNRNIALNLSLQPILAKDSIPEDQASTDMAVRGTMVETGIISSQLPSISTKKDTEKEASDVEEADSVAEISNTENSRSTNLKKASAQDYRTQDLEKSLSKSQRPNDSLLNRFSRTTAVGRLPVLQEGEVVVIGEDQTRLTKKSTSKPPPERWHSNELGKTMEALDQSELRHFGLN
ncbi:hypothetical protein AAMO2058_000820900 [Amorphochlora amoebiformis]